jgi:hypothetical protein
VIIAGATEIFSGVSNFWKLGPSRGRQTYPDFGQYVSENQFKAFCSAAPFCWSDKKHWYEDTRDIPWDVFLPCLAEFNSKRQQLLKTTMLLLDESMSGWRPKTTKLGGIPNITYEPRKPKPLGTMFRSGVECISGVLVAQDVFQLPEHQSAKSFNVERSHMPDNSDITAHTAEVLRLVESARVPKGGLAGHWVVFKTMISGVDLFAMVYAWSQKGVSYILSTYSSTEPSPKMYKSLFEDDFGKVSCKEISRPGIAHLLFDYLPLVDEQNKQRQNKLALETK